MNTHDTELISALAAATKFEVELHRLLSRSERTSRWMVRSPPPTRIEMSDDRIVSDHDLYVLVLFHSGQSQEAGLAYT